MEKLEMLRQWICTYPNWGDAPLSVDVTPPKPGTCGLFPVGETEVSRQENVLGQLKCRYRRDVILRRVAIRGEQAAGWLLDFGRWLRSQTPPALGDETCIKAEKGRLLTSVVTGIGTYEIKISIEYTEELANGKN